MDSRCACKWKEVVKEKGFWADPDAFIDKLAGAKQPDEACILVQTRVGNVFIAKTDQHLSLFNRINKGVMRDLKAARTEEQKMRAKDLAENFLKGLGSENKKLR